MKKVYPIVLLEAQGEPHPYVVWIPHFDGMTEGEDFADALDMARDYICEAVCFMEEQGKEAPNPGKAEEYSLSNAALPTDMEGFRSDCIVAYVDVDVEEYRRKNEQRTVKKNCTIPGWLAYEAEQANINFSAALQAGLKAELGIS